VTYPHLPHPPESEADWFAALANLARYLRTPEGCPWDREQTAVSFAGYIRGEIDEYIEALEQKPVEEAEEEFGDCLFTLLASATAAEDSSAFSVQRALVRCHDKMVRRHDHVFGANKARTPEEAMEAWNRIKAEEKREKGIT